MGNTAIGTMPRIGDKAPDFKAKTTTGDLQFSEFNKGSWVVMFSHPADFTPVCTTEMSAFAVDKDFMRNATPSSSASALTASTRTWLG